MKSAETKPPTPRTDAALARLRSRTPLSQAARQRGEALLASEVVPTFQMATPVYIDSAEGAYLTDLDGNRYLDMAMGFGACVLGHRPACVERAMQAQLKKGWHTVLPNVVQHALAELLLDGSPCGDSAIFTNSGTEATMVAMRVARAFTGKTRVAMFSGSYHGTHDYALVQDDPRSAEDQPAVKTTGCGVPDAVRDHTVMALPYHHEAAFDLIRQHRNELAMVAVQGVQNTTPRLDNHHFLRQLRQVCDECEVLLMFDEVVTGFRMGWKGAQGYYGVKADLATYGKIIGGGTPIGALTGRADIMALLSQSGSRGVFSGGTFSGNPLSMAAGCAALTHLKENRAVIYPELMAQSTRLGDAVNAICAEHEMPVTLMHAGSVQCLQFKAGPIANIRAAWPVNRAAEHAFYLNLLDRGVLIPGVHCYFLSAAHTEEHIDLAIDAMTAALMDCRADGLL